MRDVRHSLDSRFRSPKWLPRTPDQNRQDTRQEASEPFLPKTIIQTRPAVGPQRASGGLTVLLVALGRLVLVAVVLEPASPGSTRSCVGYHGVAPGGVRREHAVIGDEMGSGRWDQGGEFLEKGEGIEPHGRGAVGKGFSQAVEDGAVRASGLFAPAATI
jgi:hypothetical protein